MSRIDKICEMRYKGQSFRAIGLTFGISAERVRQIFYGKDGQKPPINQIERPLRTRDVAEMLNVHANTIRRWTRLGILQAWRVGPRGDRRFDRRQVEAISQINE